ncbi:MAG TPA: hypothetical protein PLB46_05900, partial [Chitinophagales bacterium]|nr:hypothetical protein [Chitinophagales bacterium]
STFGIVAMDVNNDGNLDIVSHGNFYETEIETNTQDAGIGNVLLGTGDGHFTPLHARYSGFYSCLNAKALAVITIGTNKTPVLLSTNNNNKMEAFKLVSNQKSVALNNNDAYAIITFTDGKKRRQELYTGSGYLSQNSKSVIVNDQVAEITVYDNKGNARSVYGSMLTLGSKK